MRMNRLEWILGFVLLVLLAVVGVFGYRIWTQPATVTTTNTTDLIPTAVPRANVTPTLPSAPTPTFVGTTAKTAFATANDVALKWQPDAQLVSASATWSQGVTLEMLQTGSGTWGFTFFSPGAVETAVITVIDDSGQLVQSSPYQQPNTPLPITGWDVDSESVISTFLSDGGQAFLAEEVTTTFTMSLLPTTERLEWLLTLFAPANGRSLSMRFNATSGEKLEEVAAP